MLDKLKSDSEQVKEYFLNLPDEELINWSFRMPWQYGENEYSGGVDEDGFPNIVASEKKDVPANIRETLQDICFSKAHRNPHINTSVRGKVGRLAGWGFEVTSGIWQIQKAIEEISTDPRNRLYYYLPKWLARLEIEGELFLVLTVHTDGFIEVDFVDNSAISSTGNDGNGIIFHPTKTFFPLMYNIRKNGVDLQQIPSIFCARYPEMISDCKQDKIWSYKLQRLSKSRLRPFRQFRGYYKFVVALEKGFMTKRAVSYLRTTLEWINHYENLKKYEIDHKKSAGSYLWDFHIEDPKTFKLWLSLTDEERRKTGIMAKKTPGSSIVTPPGMVINVVSPKLTSISDEDTDILRMVSAGTDEPEDVMTGRSNSPFASVKASRGPMSDRVSDEASYFKNWYINDFWGSIFFLKSAVSDFPKVFKVQEAIDFQGSKDKKTGEDNIKPKMKDIERRPEELIDITFPVSDTIDMEARARAMLGVKHGPISETLGIPNSEVARRLGIGGYARNRLRKATEDEKYPDLIYESGSVDAEQTQEKVEGEPKKPSNGNQNSPK